MGATSTQPMSPRTQPHPSKRRHKPAQFAAPKSTPINPLKSKIRDLTRLLNNTDHLPAGIRIEKERALAGYKQDLEQALEEKRNGKLIAKYHMVRFFERQKATRVLNKLKRRLAAASPGTPEYRQLQSDVHVAEIDVNYAIYHPLTEKYRSLFPPVDTADGHTVRRLVAERPDMWKSVEQCTADGSLEALRNGRLTTKSTGDKKPPSTKTPTSKRADKGGARRPKPANDEPAPKNEEESDGGFFEE